jgi:hypothetical protein
LEQNMSSSSVGRDSHNAPEGPADGPLRRRTRQSASRKLRRTEQVGFKVTADDLAEIKAACWKDGQTQADWLASAVAAVLKRGISPVQMAASPDVKQAREGLVVAATVRDLLQYALAEFAHPRVSSRRRAHARELLVFAGQLLNAAGEQLTP